MSINLEPISKLCLYISQIASSKYLLALLPSCYVCEKYVMLQYRFCTSLNSLDIRMLGRRQVCNSSLKNYIYIQNIYHLHVFMFSELHMPRMNGPSLINRKSETNKNLPCFEMLLFYFPRNHRLNKFCALLQNLVPLFVSESYRGAEQTDPSGRLLDKAWSATARLLGWQV